MANKEHFYFDTSRLTSQKLFLKEIKSVFNLEKDLIVSNLDALDDVLEGGFGLIPSGKIIVLHFRHSEKYAPYLMKDDVCEIIELLKEKELIELKYE